MSNLTRTVDRNGRDRTFVYDDLDRITDEKWWDGMTQVHHIEYDYDANSNLLELTDAFGGCGTGKN